MNYVAALIAALKLLQFLAEEAGRAGDRVARSEGRAEAFARIAQEALNDLRVVRETRAKADRDFDAAALRGGVPTDLQFRD